jgi:hypothetical protein
MWYLWAKVRMSETGTSVNKAKIWARYFSSVSPDLMSDDNFFSVMEYLRDIFTVVSIVFIVSLYVIDPAGK